MAGTFNDMEGRHEGSQGVTTTPACIRGCVPGDEQALALVGQATFLESFAGVLDGADILAHCARQHSPEIYRAWIGDPKARIWLAELEPRGAPVGYLVLAPATLPLADLEDDDLEIKRIYLLQRVQGTGLGKRLMLEAVSYARQARRSRLLLGVYGRNDRAIGFYQRQGFRPIGERRFLVGNTYYDDLILGLDLSLEVR
jgi:ribosomal protein S18 acetylase RimI-like enzyme